MDGGRPAARARPRRVAAMDLPVHAHAGAAPAGRARHRRRRRRAAGRAARQFPEWRARLARRRRDGRPAMRRARGARAPRAAPVPGAAARAGAQETAPPPPADRAAVSAAAADTVPAASGETAFLVQNLTRAELWRFFEPRRAAAPIPITRSSATAPRSARATAGRAGGCAAPSSTCGSRICRPARLARAARHRRRVLLPGQRHLQLPVLPARVEPEAEGAVARRVDGTRVASRARPPANRRRATPPIDALTRGHLNGRLLGDMEWSMYQRAWDGVRGGSMATLARARSPRRCPRKARSRSRPT